MFTIHLQSMDIRALFKKGKPKSEEAKHKAQKKVIKRSGNVSHIKYANVNMYPLYLEL